MMIAALKRQYNLVKSDRMLSLILLLHIVLIVCHVCHSFMSDINYHWELRAGGCFLIALLIFLFGRIGMSYGLTIYACVLIYVNTFYNYGSIFFILVACGANPKMRKWFIGAFLLNAVISFSLQKLIVFSFAIQAVYTVLFYVCMNYVFEIHKPETLNLAEDEKEILSELLEGKKQKEIEIYSQTTITAKLKHARERNMCETTSELLARFSAEVGTKLKVGKCGKPCKTNCKKSDECCMSEQ